MLVSYVSFIVKSVQYIWRQDVQYSSALHLFQDTLYLDKTKIKIKTTWTWIFFFSPGCKQDLFSCIHGHVTDVVVMVLQIHNGRTFPHVPHLLDKKSALCLFQQ